MGVLCLYLESYVAVTNVESRQMQERLTAADYERPEARRIRQTQVFYTNSYKGWCLMAFQKAVSSAPAQQQVTSVVQPIDRLLTSREFCGRLRISKKTLQRWIRAKRINYIRLSSGAYRFRPEAVKLFLAQREVHAA
jgi:excisionase family DNA binding protein